jgi:hypothetical protein
MPIAAYGLVRTLAGILEEGEPLGPSPASVISRAGGRVVPSASGVTVALRSSARTPTPQGGEISPV